MVTIGLSTLFLNVKKEPFSRLLEELSKGRDDQEAPEVWEVVDQGEHSLSGSNLKWLAEFVSKGFRFTLHSPYSDVNIAHLDRDRRKNSLMKLRVSLDSAASIEARAVVIHSGKVPQRGSDFKLAKVLNEESILSLYDYGRSLGLTPTVENMIPHGATFLATVTEFEEFYAETRAKIMLTFDPGHAHLGGRVKEFVTKLSHKFHSVHASDNRGTKDEHLPVGNGNVDWTYVTSELASRGFSGIYIVESVAEPFASVASLKKFVASVPHGQAGSIGIGHF